MSIRCSAQAQFQVWREIETDVDRVFMNGRARVNSAAGVMSMRRLLRAYSLHNPAVGYCQGMNFIAGMLLEVRLSSVPVSVWLTVGVDKNLSNVLF